jgi:hypothetical protein
MIAAAVSLWVTIALFAKPGPRPVQVGPIYLEESVRAVVSTLGKGWRGLDCVEYRHCEAVLVYTDGRDQLKLYIGGGYIDGGVDVIEAREGRAQGGSLLRGLPPLREWRWAGGRIFKTPSSVKGWETRWSRSEVTYTYDHPLAVWITPNPWHGRDFHMFQE